MGEYILCSVDLTNKCNLACPYCYKDTKYFDTSGSRETYMDLQQDKLLKFAKWILTSNQKKQICFQFHGGEPLIQWDTIQWFVNKIKNYTTSKTFGFGIQTNGLLLTTEKIDWLYNNGVIIGISLDGTKEQQDKNRPFLNGRGSYDKIEKNLAYLLEKFPETACQVTVVDPLTMKESLNNLAAIGFRNLIFLPVYGNASDSLDWQEQMAACHIDLAGHVAEMNRLGYQLTEKSITRPLKAFALGSTGYMCQSWPCGAGTDLVAMDINGYIYPCDTFFGLKDWSLGNIEDLAADPFDDVMNQSAIVHQLKNRKPDSNGACGTCSSQDSCGGGCPGVTLQQKGTINETDVHCHYFKKFHEGLGQMIAGDPTSAFYLTNNADLLND